MTSVTHRSPRPGRERSVTGRGLAAALAAGGCALLVVRPVLLAHTTRPVGTLVLLFLALLLVGAGWPVPGAVGQQGSLASVPVLALGLAAFAFARLLGGGAPPGPALPAAILLNTLAAVAEEAFFRRFLYAVLLPAGALVAVIGTAALFAVVHVTVYGAWVLPLDLAAGLLLSWQRWASGSWGVPAATHVLANILVVI